MHCCCALCFLADTALGQHRSAWAMLVGELGRPHRTSSAPKALRGDSHLPLDLYGFCGSSQDSPRPYPSAFEMRQGCLIAATRPGSWRCAKTALTAASPGRPGSPTFFDRCGLGCHAAVTLSSNLFWRIAGPAHLPPTTDRVLFSLILVCVQPVAYERQVHPAQVSKSTRSVAHRRLLMARCRPSNASSGRAQLSVKTGEGSPRADLRAPAPFPTLAPPE
jgi:hypothetical protein